MLLIEVPQSTLLRSVQMEVAHLLVHLVLLPDHVPDLSHSIVAHPDHVPDFDCRLAVPSRHSLDADRDRDGPGESRPSDVPRPRNREERKELHAAASGLAAPRFSFFSPPPSGAGLPLPLVSRRRTPTSCRRRCSFTSGRVRRRGERAKTQFYSRRYLP
jgi:hypothetical protein